MFRIILVVFFYISVFFVGDSLEIRCDNYLYPPQFFALWLVDALSNSVDYVVFSFDPESIRKVFKQKITARKKR